MNHVFELKTRKRIELTSEELSEFVRLLKVLSDALPDKRSDEVRYYPAQLIYQNIPYPTYTTYTTCEGK